MTIQISGTTGVTFPDATAQASAAALHGQCRLTKSGANLLLSPLNGNKLIINGTAQAVPSAGVTLAPTGLSAGTNYYIYAWMNAGTMTLEASTTTHAKDATTGVEIKNGDATRTLVGLVRVVTGPAFADSATQRNVVSWFNQPRRNILNTLGSDLTGVGAAWVSLGATCYAEYVTFDGVTDIDGVSTSADANAGAISYLSVAIDGSQRPIQGYATTGNGVAGKLTANVRGDFAEGFHTIQLYCGGVNTTFYAGYTGITGRV